MLRHYDSPRKVVPHRRPFPSLFVILGEPVLFSWSI
jgi:hypothetical protein